MDKLKAVLRMLDGKKTYLATIALGLVGLAWSAGWIDDETARPIMVVLASAAGLSIRQAVSKSESAAKNASDMVSGLASLDSEPFGLGHWTRDVNTAADELKREE